MSKKLTKPIIALKVLPGEPLDGTGKVCIHLFVPDPNGPFTESHALHLRDIPEVGKKLVAEPTKGRLACDPKRLVEMIQRNNVKHITVRTSEPSAVTCPKCIESIDYKRTMEVVDKT